MPGLHIDGETRSPVNLKTAGVYAYFEHPDTDAWCASWAIEDGDIALWNRGEDAPTRMRRWIEAGNPITAHNAGFEYALFKYVLGPKHGWPVPELEQMYCTAAMAAAMSLPRSLDGASEAMKLEVRKDDAGRRLMLQMMKPRNNDGPPYVWWDVPEKVQRLGAYCCNDTAVERALESRLRPLPPFERRLWLLDQRINMRGVRIDLDAVRDAQDIVAAELHALNGELGVLTNHAVKAATNHAALTAWLREKGLDIDGVDKRTLKDVLPTIDDPVIRRVIEIRQQAGKASTSKLKAMLARASNDGRARDNVMYHGAHTGRFSGRGIQMHNFPRPEEAYENAALVEQVFECLPSRDRKVIMALFGPPLPVLSNVLKSFIIAADGCKILNGDFKNIEGRGVAWLAGEESKLEVFRAFDRGEGPEVYRVAAAKVFGRPHDTISKPERQVGKVGELACGFQGGVGSYVSMGANYDIKPDAIAKVIRQSASEAALARADEKWNYRLARGLERPDWAAIRVVVDAWRAAHPNIVQYWYDLEEAALNAVFCPGRGFRVRNVAFACHGNVLWCQLPSGRLLSYIDPKIRDVDTPWGEMKTAVTYMIEDSVTKQWRRHKGYGGLFCANVTQATARDVMAEAMVRVEEAGYPVIHTVHDDVVTEPDATRADKDEFERLMCVLPPWARGFPIVVDAAMGHRYGK